MMLSRILAKQGYRGRRHSGMSGTASRLGHRFKHSASVSLQLDYYMSPQFAGIACAMVDGLYDNAGIDLRFLPICKVGLEAEGVRSRRGESLDDVVVGSVEQNILIPLLQSHPHLDMKAVAAMFRTSPLCLASVEGREGQDKNVVGAHEDTVELLQRILKKGAGSSAVVASPRATKVTDLLEGRLSEIQAYATTEVPTLERALEGAGVSTTPLEGLNGAKLGYSQVLFAPAEDLKSNDKREILQSFLDATFTGWGSAVRDPESAARSVEEAKAMLGLDDENNDHWDPSFEYTVQSVALCGDYVKESFQGDRYGVINAERWNEATEWLLDGKSPDEENFGLDATLWQPPSDTTA